MYVCIYVCMCLFPPLFNFFRVPLNVLVLTMGVRVPQVGNHCLKPITKANRRNGSEEGKNIDCVILKFGTDFKESMNGATTQHKVSNSWNGGTTQHKVSNSWKPCFR
jgi:hypothetical protein